VIAEGPAFFGLLLVVAMVMWLLYDAARGGTKYEPTQAERDAYAEEQLEELGLDEAEFIKPQR
jgi:cytochrome c-type biogenesis protein CcmH/NrfG